MNPSSKTSSVAPCILCVQTHPVSLLEERGEYSLFYCRDCKLRFSDPMANPGQSFYEDNRLYENRALGAVSLSLPALDWKCRAVVRHPQAMPGERLLDIGAGDGGMLSFARAHGMDSYGIELDTRGVRIARELRGLDHVEQGDFRRVDALGWKDFDRVSMLEVLEHLDNPKDVAARLFGLLAPGGHAYVSVPRWDRNPRFFDPETDYPPHHFTLWTESSLKILFEGAGFTNVRVIKAPFMLQSMLYLLAKRWKRRRSSPTENETPSATPPIAPRVNALRVNHRRVWAKATAYRLCDVIDPLFAWIPGLRGTGIMVVGQKPR